MKLFDHVNKRRQQGIDRAAAAAGEAWKREATEICAQIARIAMKKKTP